MSQIVKMTIIRNGLYQIIKNNNCAITKIYSENNMTKIMDLSKCNCYIFPSYLPNIHKIYINKSTSNTFENVICMQNNNITTHETKQS